MNDPRRFELLVEVPPGLDAIPVLADAITLYANAMRESDRRGIVSKVIAGGAKVNGVVLSWRECLDRAPAVPTPRGR